MAVLYCASLKKKSTMKHSFLLQCKQMGLKCLGARDWIMWNSHGLYQFPHLWTKHFKHTCLKCFVHICGNWYSTFSTLVHLHWKCEIKLKFNVNGLWNVCHWNFRPGLFCLLCVYWSFICNQIKTKQKHKFCGLNINHRYSMLNGMLVFGLFDLHFMGWKTGL